MSMDHDWYIYLQLNDGDLLFNKSLLKLNNFDATHKLQKNIFIFFKIS